MRKAALAVKRTQQPTLASFFSKKATNANSSTKAGAQLQEKSKQAATDGVKRKRVDSPVKSPAKTRKMSTPTKADKSPAKTKTPSPSKKIEQYFSPVKTKQMSIAVRNVDISDHVTDDASGHVDDDVQYVGSFKSPVKSSESGVRRSPRLAAKNAPGKPQSSKESVAKVKTKLFSPDKNVEQTAEDFDLANLDEAFFEEMKELESSPVIENLNLAKLDRYKVLSSSSLPSSDLKLVVKNLSNSTTGSCTIKSPWSSSIIREGDIVSLKGTQTGGEWVVDWSGTLVTDPDHLISGTTVVGSLFCMRKAVLSEIFEELGESDPKHLVIGLAVHQLLQEVLQKKIRDRDAMEQLCEKMIQSRDFVVDLFHQNLDYAQTTYTIKTYLPKIYDFISSYVTYGKAERLAPKQPENWSGEIVTVRDIEDSIWSPRLGIKGKIDATVQVKINNKSKVMPLELKTGKVSFSVEHRGQVILYCMLLKELGEFVDSGLLLYLKDEGGLKEIRAGDREIRDLILLRNSLSRGLLDLSNVAASNNIRLPDLPPPINRKFCENCGHVIACTAALRDRGVENLSEKHRMRSLVPQATSHLSDEHLRFIFHWIGLQSLENGCSKSNVSKMWTEDPKKREESGMCLTDMMVTSTVVTKGARFETVFTKARDSVINDIFEIGQTVIVSSSTQIGLCYGFVNAISPISVTVSVEKYFKAKEGPFMLDCYESLSAKKMTMKNISLLLEDSEKGRIMRDIIIDLKLPTFAPKLPGKIKKLGMDIFERLNKEQVRALLQAVSADTYILIQGMPGTGKTTTMRALIELMVRMGKRVLVSSYTHSAIDNILVGLVGKVDMLRVVNPNRAHPKLKDFTEQACLNKISNPTAESLEKMYKSKQVVGVSCLSAGHPVLERQSFDICLVDEASQVTQPAVLRPLFLAKKFILVGDPKQLPPLVVNEQAKEYGLATSLFHRLDRPAVTSKLTQQYRMNQKITDLANGFAYENMLKCGTEGVANATIDYPGSVSRSEQWISRALSKRLDDSVIVVDVKSDAGSSKSKDNRAEAEVVVQIAREMMKVGIPGSSIGVIGTYREQVDLLKNLLRGSEVEISTVDQYQGRDKEIILYTSSKTSAKVENDILSDTNRLTVAITRAKKKLILVCHVDFVSTYENFAKLFSHTPPGNFVSTST